MCNLSSYILFFNCLMTNSNCLELKMPLLNWQTLNVKFMERLKTFFYHPSPLSVFPVYLITVNIQYRLKIEWSKNLIHYCYLIWVKWKPSLMCYPTKGPHSFPELPTLTTTLCVLFNTTLQVKVTSDQGNSVGPADLHTSFQHTKTWTTPILLLGRVICRWKGTETGIIKESFGKSIRI